MSAARRSTGSRARVLALETRQSSLGLREDRLRVLESQLGLCELVNVGRECRSLCGLHESLELCESASEYARANHHVCA